MWLWGYCHSEQVRIVVVAVVVVAVAAVVVVAAAAVVVEAYEAVLQTSQSHAAEDVIEDCEVVAGLAGPVDGDVVAVVVVASVGTEGHKVLEKPLQQRLMGPWTFVGLSHLEEAIEVAEVDEVVVQAVDAVAAVAAAVVAVVVVVAVAAAVAAVAPAVDKIE